MRRIIVSTLLAMVISPVAGLAETHTQAIEFPPGGSLRFRLRGGDLSIKRGTDPKHIVVRYAPEKPQDEKNIQVRSQIQGSQVQIAIKSPRSVGVKVELEVPSPISLDVHMTGGDLTVEGVEGDKNLRLFAGDMKVDVGALQNLRDAAVSVSVGDLEVPSAGQAHGWLGHTWKYQGSGPYRLYAHTTFGDATLVASGRTN